eukprot:gene85-91_t
MEASINVWCHSCGEERTAQLQDESGEYLCNVCQGSFVEKVDQGVESFLTSAEDRNHVVEEQDLIEEPPTSSFATTSSSSTSSASSSSDNRVTASNRRSDSSPASSSSSDGRGSEIFPLGNVLGRIANSSSAMSLSNDAGVPIGMVIRQRSAVNMEDVFPSGLSRGLLGLLVSLASTRQNQAASFGPSNFMSDENFEQLLHHILMNENSHAGVPPAEQCTIDHLQRDLVKQETLSILQGECSISQEAFEVGDIIVSLPCGHRYKEEPITQWLKMHNSCPVCRVGVSSSISAP